MIEIKYGGQYEVVDMAGQTVSEAREQFRNEFGIPEQARAKLNGSNVKGSAEPDTVLNDDDKLSFAVAKSRGAYLVGALLLAMAVTGGVFAFGFINASTSLTATIAETNFADVSLSSEISNISWTGFGFFKGAIGGPNGIFNVSPASGYPGDLAVSVTIGNADQLAKRYRVLALKLEMVLTSNNTTVDINENDAADADEDWVMLTLDNGSVSMFPDGAANMIVRVKNGFYITHVTPFGGWTGSASPDLFCEVAQR